MFRRLVITLTMLLALPAFANATWYVTASKSGGDATCTVSPASSTIPGFSGSQAVTVTPGAGYQVNKVTIDGATQTLAANGQYTINYTAGKTYRTLVAYFGTAVVPGANITVTPPANSTYRVTSPVNGSITNITLGSNRTIAIIPVSGYAVSNVVVGGAGSAACVVSDSLQFAGAKDVTCTNIQAAITIGASSGVSQTVSANAGPDRTVSAANSAITLNGSGTFTVGPATYAWTKVSGPGTVTFGTAAAAATTFSASAAGTYVVQLQVSAAGATAATDTATITVANATQTAENSCSSCHTSRNPAVITAYDASSHKANNLTCQGCHDPSNTGHYTTTAATCESCHAASLSTTTHPVAITASKCIVCHDSHNPAQGIADLTPAPAHPAVTLYTFEEVGYQMNNGQPVPVQVDASGKGLPYSPKMTCGTSGCHVINGVNYTYDKISDHAFHSAQGRNEFMDTADGKFDVTKNKPWYQSTAMVGKW
jgi:hypothetical protein